MRSSELNAWWAWVSATAMFLARLLFKIHVEGVANVPAEGPAILAFNHVSVLDGPVLAIEVARRRRRESRFLVASEIFDQLLAGSILRSFHQIPIRRGEGDLGALEEAIRIVRRGTIAAIAPEGRVNEDPNAGLLRLHRGVARLALPTGAPVIPVGFWGTQERWPKTGLRVGRPWRPRAALVFGEPIPAHGEASEPDDIDAFTDEVRRSLQTQVARARAIAEAR